jgi:hypothetical protein
VPTVEDFTYIEAPPEVVYRLLADLAQYGRFAPPGMRVHDALTLRTDEPGARIAISLRIFGPFRPAFVLQVHALEPPRCVIAGTPDAATFVTRWTLEPEPPGTVTAVTVDYRPTNRLTALLGGLVQVRLQRTYRDLLARLRAVAEQENPARRV